MQAVRQHCSPPTVPASPTTARCSLRRLTVLHAVRGRQVAYDRAVRALDGGGGSRSSTDKLPREKVEAAAAAKPSMRSPRVTRSSSSPSANGARRPPSIEARPRPAQSLHTGALDDHWGACMTAHRPAAGKWVSASSNPALTRFNWGAFPSSKAYHTCLRSERQGNCGSDNYTGGLQQLGVFRRTGRRATLQRHDC